MFLTEKIAAVLLVLHGIAAGPVGFSNSTLKFGTQSIGMPAQSQLLSGDDMSKIISFMTSDINTGTSGVAYTATAGDLKGKLLPLGFWTGNRYFGEYLCKNGITSDGSPANCNVVDVFNAQTSEVFPQESTDPGVKVAGELQIERLNIVHGLNIYDGSCWQLTMALLGSKLQRPDLLAYSDNIDLMLKLGYSGDDSGNPPVVNTERSNKPLNGQTLSPESSFFYRYWPRKWLSKDPLMDGYDQFISVSDNFPKDSAEYQRGVVSWADFKPITGENAWAIYIGPLQSAYLRDVVTLKRQCVNFNGNAVQTAIKALPWIQAMQSQTGAVWYAPSFSLGNTGSETVNKYIVSVENNASLIGGLVMLRQILESMKANNGQSSDCSFDQAQMQTALNAVNDILSGGRTPGMFSFFANHAIDMQNMKIHSGGFADQDGAGIFVPYTKDQSADAVDVMTWGLSVLGVPYVDGTKGFGTTFKMWQALRERSGFFVNNLLYGFGYSERDGNGRKGNADQGIMSAEWTFGAINFCKVMIAQYQDMLDFNSALTQDERNQIPGMINELTADMKSMLTNINVLRSDKYGSAVEMSAHRPQGHDWNQLVNLNQGQLSFLYASKRYFIPFGWMSNPLPSTTSTAWAVMMEFDFNPFNLGGSMKSKIPAPSV